MNFSKSEIKSLRKFAITMTIAFFLIGAILLYLKKLQITYVMWGISGGMFALGVPYPPLIWPVERVWMKFAAVLGWINTRILLTAIFYLMFFPMGILMRLFGNDPLKRKLDKNAKSYWNDREQKEVDPESYSRQY